jgi:hypothetical protein
MTSTPKNIKNEYFYHGNLSITTVHSTGQMMPTGKARPAQ